MRLVLIENRYKTRFYEAVVPFLQEQGHEVFWIVQNPSYTPQEGIVRAIPFPKGNPVTNRQPLIKLDHIIASDRQVNFFGNHKTGYFAYYAIAIEDILRDIQPDIVFGESTAFHELITIELCKAMGILYLNPSTCRYPTGRFSFYRYDSLEPHMGSDEVLEDADAFGIIQSIVKKEAKPDYMKKIGMSKKKVLGDKLQKTLSYMRGEKFNTPNPLVKYKLEKTKKNNINQWEIGSLKEIPEEGHIKILYPLQMQPEANLDVWGRKWRDQTELIRKIAEILPEDAVLYVKPNPKSKYELSRELVDLCQNHSKIRHISHGLNMEGTFPFMDLVVTVTGTIAIECILSNKPVVTLAKTLNNSQPNCIYLEELNGLTELIDMVRSSAFPTITEEDKIAFINKLNRTSYKGEVNDPFSSPTSIGEENKRNIAKAFESVLMKTSV